MRNKIVPINQAMLHAIQEAGIEEQFGVTIEFGSSSYGDTNYRTKVEVTENAADGSRVTQAQYDYETQAVFFGLQPEWFGESFDHRGKKATIVGLKPRSRKYPVLVTIAGRKGMFKLTAQEVIQNLQ